MSDFNSEVGKRIEEVRRDKGLTLKQLGDYKKAKKVLTLP